MTLLAHSVGHDHVGGLAAGLALLALAVAAVGAGAWLLWIVARGETSSAEIERPLRFWIVIPLAWLSEAGLFWLAATAVRNGRTGLAWSLGGLALIVLLAAIVLVTFLADPNLDVVLEPLSAIGLIVLAVASLGWLTVDFAGEGQLVFAGLLAGLTLALLLSALLMFDVDWMHTSDGQDSVVSGALVLIPVASLGAVTAKLALDGRAGFAQLVGGVAIVVLLVSPIVVLQIGPSRLVHIARRRVRRLDQPQPWDSEVVLPLPTEGRFVRVVLAGAFPFAVIGAIVAFGLVLQLRGGRVITSPAALAAQLFGVSVVAGVASMATVQVVKSLLGIRGLYQRRQVMVWFVSNQFGYEGFWELLTALGASGTSDRRASRYVFDLPIELVCAQVSGAADVAMADPGRFRAFLARLAGEDAVVGRRRPPMRPEQDSSQLGEPDLPIIDDTDAQIRLSHYVRTGIDQLQVSVGYRWRTYIRATAVWLSGLIGIAIVEVSHPPSRERGLYILAAVLVGGFVSWFARDVVAVVERLRG